MKRVCLLARRGDRRGAIAELTSKKVNANQISVQGRSILLFAVCGGNYELVENLLKFGCNPNCQGPFGENPLSLAAKMGHSKMVELLAGHGADLNQKDGSGRTVMDHLASRGDCSDLVLRLQEATGLVLCRLGCGIVMPPGELADHETSLCENAVVSCPYCYEVLGVKDFRDQHDCPEEPVKCGMCGQWHPAKEAIAHELHCEKTFKYRCEICNERVLFCAKIDHQRHSCMERIVECPRGCGETFAAKHRPSHLLESCAKRIVDCPQCGDALEACNLKLHRVTKCIARPTTCRFGCQNIRSDRLREHEESHLRKDLLLFTPHELSWWIEENVDFRGDNQLAFRVQQCFLGHEYSKKLLASQRQKGDFINETIGHLPERRDVPISGRRLSSMWRSKLFTLLCQEGRIDRPFAKSLLDKIGSSLRTSCPRGCNTPPFLLDDRKDHADFCPLGICKCLRCGKSVIRRELTTAHRSVCPGKGGVRRWPVRKTRHLGAVVTLNNNESFMESSNVVTQQRHKPLDGQFLSGGSSLATGDSSVITESDALKNAGGVESGRSELPEI